MTPTRDELLAWFHVEDGKLYWKQRPANRVRIGSQAGSSNRNQPAIISVPKHGRFSVQTLLDIINA